ELKMLEAKKAAAAASLDVSFTFQDEVRRLDLIRQQAAANTEGASKTRDWQRAQEQFNQQVNVTNTDIASLGEQLRRAAEGAKDIKLPADASSAKIFEAWNIELNKAKQ